MKCKVGEFAIPTFSMTVKKRVREKGTRYFIYHIQQNFTKSYANVNYNQF